MSMVLQVPPVPATPLAPTVTWERLSADFLLPDDPVENIQQPPLAAALTDALGANGRIQPQKRAEQERQRAEVLATKLRELGIDPDPLV